MSNFGLVRNIFPIRDLNALISHIIYLQNKLTLDLQLMNVTAFLSLGPGLNTTGLPRVLVSTKLLFIQKVQNFHRKAESHPCVFPPQQDYMCSHCLVPPICF